MNYPLGCAKNSVPMRCFSFRPGCAVALLASLACRDNPLAPLPATLVTDATRYTALPGNQLGMIREYSFTIVARFTNSSRYTVHLSRCYSNTPYPIYGIDVVGQDTTAAYSPGWACVGGNYFHVAPGQTRVDTLPVRAPWGMDGRTGEAFGVFEGQFVVVYEMYGCVDETPECKTPIIGSARSGVFTVTRAK